MRKKYSIRRLIHQLGELTSSTIRKGEAVLQNNIRNSLSEAEDWAQSSALSPCSSKASLARSSLEIYLGLLLACSLALAFFALLFSV